MIGKFFSLAKAVRKIKPRIGPGTAFLMIFFAIVIDLVQIAVNFVLDEIFLIGFVVDWLITIAMVFALWLWFRFNGVKLTRVVSAKGKPNATGVIAFVIAFIIKMIPIVNALPAWTADVMINIAVSWIEDLAAQEESGLLAKALPGGRKALSKGAKRQALQARSEGRMDRYLDIDSGRYGTNRQKESPEREGVKRDMNDYYDKLAEEHMNPSQLQEYKENQQKVDGISPPKE
ncbi:MAG: hypothetical protein PHV93_02465 [Candidatus Pacebacteria bacterium]|nr:hypothetical protein [Candidatus Paceibacterota bacterium]